MEDFRGEAVDVRGHCYCGQVKFRVLIPEGQTPVFTAYCHCDGCRRSHAAPLYQVAAVKTEHFNLESGAEHVQEFQRVSGKIVRAFCKICGSKLYNRFPSWTPRAAAPTAFFPALLETETLQSLPDALRPRKVVHGDQCILDKALLRDVLDEM